MTDFMSKMFICSAKTNNQRFVVRPTTFSRLFGLLKKKRLNMKFNKSSEPNWKINH